jgi:hypothetical protein
VEDLEWQQVVAAATRVELCCDHYLEPDGGIAVDYAGPRLVVVSFSLRVCTLGEGCRTVAETDLATALALVHAAGTVIADPDRIMPGVDTAVGRWMTMLRIRVDDPMTRGSHTRVAPINHHAPHALPATWSHLIGMLHDAAGPLSPAAEALWDVALVWCGPIDLGDAWRAGHPVRVPHRVTAVAAGAPIYLRTGQLPAPSSLYLVDAEQRLVHHLVDAGAPRSIDVPRAGWTALPCGAAELRIEDGEWGVPPRLLVRVTDSTRWAYLQRG